MPSSRTQRRNRSQRGGSKMRPKGKAHKNTKMIRVHRTVRNRNAQKNVEMYAAQAFKNYYNNDSKQRTRLESQIGKLKNTTEPIKYLENASRVLRKILHLERKVNGPLRDDIVIMISTLAERIQAVFATHSDLLKEQEDELVALFSKMAVNNNNNRKKTIYSENIEYLENKNKMHSTETPIEYIERLITFLENIVKEYNALGSKNAYNSEYEDKLSMFAGILADGIHEALVTKPAPQRNNNAAMNAVALARNNAANLSFNLASLFGKMGVQNNNATPEVRNLVEMMKKL